MPLAEAERTLLPELLAWPDALQTIVRSRLSVERLSCWTERVADQQASDSPPPV